VFEVKMDEVLSGMMKPEGEKDRFGHRETPIEVYGEDAFDLDIDLMRMLDL
jgi:hypothetical protein